MKIFKSKWLWAGVIAALIFAPLYIDVSGIFFCEGKRYPVGYSHNLERNYSEEKIIQIAETKGYHIIRGNYEYSVIKNYDGNASKKLSEYKDYLELHLIVPHKANSYGGSDITQWRIDVAAGKSYCIHKDKLVRIKIKEFLNEFEIESGWIDNANFEVDSSIESFM